MQIDKLVPRKRSTTIFGTVLENTSNTDVSLPSEVYMNHLHLAAFYGHSKVLEKIIEFYNKKEMFGKKKEGKVVSLSRQMSRTISSDTRKEFSNWNPFDEITSDSWENVLHLILKGPFTSGYPVKNNLFDPI